MIRLRSLLLLPFITATLALSQPNVVHVITVDGAINPASADYIRESIQSAASGNAQCLVIRLNTPGGLLKSTRVIVSDILASPIPVVVYVSPPGSQAASAGVFITLAAHFAVMSPGTNIGAAHPVTLGEQKDSVMIEKATNDAAAFIRTISEKRHRNISWAEDAVRKSISITEKEALRLGVIDTIAAGLRDLLLMIDGKNAETSSGNKVISTKMAEIREHEKSFQQKLLDILSDPNFAYILMMLGIYGLLFELYNPGSILPGIVGTICLVLAFYSMHTLPINYAGLALILFAIILFLLEIKIVSHGLLAIGGTVSLFLGSIMLFKTSSFIELLAVSWEVIILTVVLTAMFFLFAISMGIKAQKRKKVGGIEGMIGETGEAASDLRPDGLVKVHGEIWKATSLDGSLKRGSRVEVAETENLNLKVRKIN